ncbi:MAG TPA: hypothetical protein PLO50_04450, partial [Nitrospira sp.]|nr:hypothetical protein [Nitrospira sp.]
LNIRIATPPRDRANKQWMDVNPGICSSYVLSRKPGDKVTISGGKEGDLARASAVVQTMKQAFPALESFAVEGPWKTGMSPAKNLVFFGGRFIEQTSADYVLAKITETAMNQRLPMETIALLNTRRTDPWPQGVVLTDDFAPYDLLLGRERSQLVE